MMKKRGLSVIEIVIVGGIIAVLLAALIPRAVRLRRQQLDARIISDLQNINIQLKAFHARKGYYPDNLQELVDEGLMSSLPKIPGANTDYFYQRNYKFVGWQGGCATTLVATRTENISWMQQGGKLPAFFKALSQNTCFAGNAGFFSEALRQYYAIDLNSGGVCDQQAKINEVKKVNGQPVGQVLYRLGSPLYAPEPAAISDGTPCSDRFFDILGL